MEELSLAALRERAHWSASSINTLLNVCSLQWAFQHVYSVQPEFTSPALVFGQAFHQACSHYSRERMRGHALPAAAIVECFVEDFNMRIQLANAAVRFDNGQGQSELSAKGGAMIQAWHAALDPDEEPVAVGKAFAMPLIGSSGHAMEKPLIGEFDLVTRVAGQMVVVDWKTSASRWPTDKAHKELQPVCYLFAAESYWPDHELLFRFDVVTKQKTPVVERFITVRTRSEYARFCRVVEVLDQLVEQELFLPAEQSYFCKGCPYQGACRKWHKESFAHRKAPAAA